MKMQRFLSIAALLSAVSLSPLTAQEGADTEKEEEKFDIAVELTGNDLMKYDKEAFTVEEGKVVKLSFKNIGKQPKIVMGHNVVILAKGTDVTKFALESAKAGPAKDYIPDSAKDQILAKTKLLGPGETDTIYFTAPAKGVYDYVCTFPGHFALMKGKMTVK